jgi:hypothetical protein
VTDGWAVVMPDGDVALPLGSGPTGRGRALLRSLGASFVYVAHRVRIGRGVPHHLWCPLPPSGWVVAACPKCGATAPRPNEPGRP